ncbi:arsenic resistance protein [Cryobacterium adonitolivorans]|uniref:Arsenic resistance protein n=1 Tax=Cryobacterium adonitolivorans TaxID=1259189 RepID=A0A4R8W079_9MICO|nr:arsenic resistance protein [Cryobacterium adonitolivorans]TFB99579.1 arsenic resistance protein [Cryobacterium adonitolivorans]
MAGIVQRLEHRQVALFLTAIALGALVGWLAPGTAPTLSAAITPVLGLLLFATFLAVPLVSLGRSFWDLRFLGTVLTVNFVIVPDKLLAATPLLMLLQIVLLPVYLWLIAGTGAVALIEVRPLVEAFLVLIVLPLAAAAAVQFGTRRRRAARAIETLMQALMVPLMMTTLAVVVGSQVSAVGAQAAALPTLIPLYIAFLIVMVGIGVLAAGLAGLPVPAARALIFSGATRNSLVVLPLALALPLALPPALALAPLAVVTQTLVELVGLAILVRLVPRLVPGSPSGADRS